MDNHKNASLKKWTKRATFIFWLIIGLVPIVGIIFSLVSPISFFGTQAEWRAFALKFGFYGPVFFVLLQILQVVVAPISHYSVGYMGGFLYGTWLGAILNYIGRVIGHICAFWISRLLGRRLANRFVSPRTLAKYDKYFTTEYSYLILFLIYFLPLFPDDEIGYLVGLSKMDFKKYVTANIFGHISGSLSLAYIGSGIKTRDPLFWALIGVHVVAFMLLWYIHKRKRSKQELAQPPRTEITGR